MNIVSNTPKENDISITQLEQVFATFNKVSSELGSSYKELEERVAGLSEELAATHSARLQELSKKEKLAAKLSVLMAALPGGVIVLDANAIIKEENPAAISILGSSCIGKSWIQSLKQAGADKYLFNGEVSLPEDRRISLTSSRYGQDLEKIILLTDISESYRLNNLIHREQRLSALGEMAAKLAHQVRTPLSSAILYLSHISSTDIGRERSNEVVAKIQDRLRQIESLVEGMLSYIRGGSINNEEFSLNNLLRDVEDSRSLQVKAVQGQLFLRYPDHDCLLRGNREALFNAISNLIDNSIQAVKTQPLITISLNHENKQYIITIKDNGPGIDSTVKDKIFDPFFSTKERGTGLGLAVVLSAVKAHKGEIIVENDNDGGSIFQLIIPAAEAYATTQSSIWGDRNQHVFYKQIGRN